MQKNRWLKTGGVDFEDDPEMEKEYGFNFVYTADVEILEMYFDHGNWSIRNGIIFETLAFVNQVNGGDEWATFKLVESGRWEQFESHTFAPMIERGSFVNYIKRLVRRRVKKEDYFLKS